MAIKDTPFKIRVKEVGYWIDEGGIALLIEAMKASSK
jgi:hypothetical protein